MFCLDRFIVVTMVLSAACSFPTVTFTVTHHLVYIVVVV